MIFPAFPFCLPLFPPPRNTDKRSSFPDCGPFRGLATFPAMKPGVLILSLAVAAAGPLPAQTYTWTGADPLGNDWSSGANWHGGAAPASASGTRLDFGAFPSSGGVLLQDIAAPFLLNGLAFTAAAAGSFDLRGNGLRFVGHGTGTITMPQIIMSAAHDQTISQSVDLASQSVLLGGAAPAGQVLGITGELTGDGTLGKFGAFTLALGAANSYSGRINVDNGLLRLDHADAAMAARVSVGGNGRLQIAVPFARIGSLAGSAPIDFGSSSVTVGAAAIEDTAYTGVLAGSGTLTKTGGHVWELGAANSFSGVARIDGGAIRLGTANALANSTVSVNVHHGLDVNGHGTVTLGALAGTGDLDLGGTNLTLGGNNASTAYGGAFTTTGGLRKEGTGEWTVRGSVAGDRLLITRGTVAIEAGASLSVDMLQGGNLANERPVLRVSGVDAGGVGASATIQATSSSDSHSLAIEALSGGLVTVNSTLYASRRVTLLAQGVDASSGLRSTLDIGNLNFSQILPPAAKMTVADGGLITIGTIGPVNNEIADPGVGPTILVTGRNGGTGLRSTLEIGQWHHGRFTYPNWDSFSLRVEEGGRLITHDVTAPVPIPWDFTVTGEESAWIHEGTAPLPLAVNLILADGGSLQSGSGLVLDGATVTLDGGRVETASLALGANASTLHWNSGEVRFTTGQQFGAESGLFQLLGDDAALGTGRVLSVNGRLDVLDGYRIKLDGGILRAGESGLRTGDLDWRGGEVHITGLGGLATAGGSHFQNTILSAGQTLDVTHRLTVSNGDFLALAGGALRAGELLLDGSAVVVASGALDMDGIGFLRGSGSVLGRVTGGAASTIRADGSLTLGNAAVADAVQFEGTLEAGGDGLIVLLSATQTRLGHATTLEQGARLSAPNGLLLAEGSTLTATGNARIDGDFENQGLVSGPSAAGETLVFYNNVTGAGDFSGTVLFLLEYAPGNSPASIHFDGDLQFASSATLRMEIGGTLHGQEYDALTIGGDLLAAGTLQLSLIGGYAPVYGASFRLFDWGTQSGWFDAVLLPELSGELEWDASFLASTGLIFIVPEPSAGVLFILGAGALLFRRQRKEK